MHYYFKTPGAAGRLGVPCTRLYSLIRYKKIDPPEKDSSGDYIWTARDLDAVRKLLSLAPGPAPAPARCDTPVPQTACDELEHPAGECLASQAPDAPVD